MHPSRSFPFWLAAALLLANAQAGVVLEHRYRLGEDDPGVAAGQTVATSRDSLGTAHLTNAPGTTPSYSAVVPGPPARSALSVNFFGNEALVTNDVISTATDNFGLELWVRPAVVTGPQCLAYNGDTAGFGWGIYLVDGTYGALFGGVAFVTGGTATPGVWTHLALVRSNGDTTLYVNGAAVASFGDAPAPPVGRFVVGAAPSAAGEFYLGAVDDVRTFVFAPGQFSPLDLQYFAPYARVSQPAGNPLAPGASRDFGATVLGQTSDLAFVLQSLGNQPLSNVLVALYGPDAASFSLLGAPGGNVAADAPFAVRFSPGSTGTKTATLRIVSSDADSSPFDIPLSGVGTVGADIAVFNGVSTSPADERTDNAGVFQFPNTPRNGTSPAQMFTIKNAGFAPLTDLAVSVSGAQAAEFTATAPAISTLDPGASVTFSVTFRPANAGLRTAVVSIGSNDPDESPFEINVAGLSNGPEIVLEQPPGTPLLTGTVVVWGINSAGQLDVPSGLHAVRSISAGPRHTLARRGDGTVVTWGNPGQPGLADVPADLLASGIGAGGSHSLAVRANGTVAAWGGNSGGECNVPLNLTNVAAVAGGQSYSIAHKSDSTLVTWGSNFSGILTPPAGATVVRAIACARSHALALKFDTTVAAWGANGYGECDVPAGLTGVLQVSAGFLTSMALKSDGTVAVWGTDLYGQNNVPPGLNAVRAVAAGGIFCLALRADGTITQWGSNTFVPPPATLLGVRAIAAGDQHGVALVNAIIPFGNQSVGTTSAAKTVLIRNTGPDTLSVSGVQMIGENASDFRPFGLVGNVLPGGQASFTLSFTPSAPGLRTATMRVLSNDSDEGEYEVALTGIGTTQSALQSWRQTYFGSPDNTGNGADTFDFDRDGLTNLVEYAFGLDPTAASSAQLPQPQWVGGKLGFRFTQPAGVSGVTYGAEWSTTLQAGGWQPLSDTGAGGQHIFEFTPNGATRVFLRLVVTATP